VLNGYPGSVAATWQRFGRAGRRQQASLGVLVASSQPLDQYVVRHPDFFADSPPEHARVAPDQPLILFDHIRCAAFELPFVAGEMFGGHMPASADATHIEPLGPTSASEPAPLEAASAARPHPSPVDPELYLQALAETEVVHREGERWEWIADSYPAQAVSLRSVADGNFVVVDRTDGRQLIIAEVDYSAAALTLYEGAIHMIQSTPYQVERLDWEGRKAYVVRTHVDYYTDSIDFTKLKVLDRFEGGSAGQGDCHHGEVHVVRRVAGYKKIRYYTHENIGYGPVNLPDQELHTTAVWWQLPQPVLLRAFDSKQEALDGFLGAAHALHVVATLAVMADPRDLQKSVGNGDGAWYSTQDRNGRGQVRGAEDAPGAPAVAALASKASTAAFLESQAFTPTVYLYDNFPGGVGLSEPLWQRQAELVQRALELITRCDCRAGCPACVGPVLAAQEDEATQTPKSLASKVLQLLSLLPLAGEGARRADEGAFGNPL